MDDTVVDHMVRWCEAHAVEGMRIGFVPGCPTPITMMS